MNDLIGRIMRDLRFLESVGMSDIIRSVHMNEHDIFNIRYDFMMVSNHPLPELEEIKDYLTIYGYRVSIDESIIEGSYWIEMISKEAIQDMKLKGGI